MPLGIDGSVFASTLAPFPEHLAAVEVKALMASSASLSQSAGGQAAVEEVRNFLWSCPISCFSARLFPGSGP